MLAQRFRVLLSAVLVLGSELGCQTSCADSDQRQVVWRDGVVTEEGNLRVYQSTAMGDRWLHFPSHRRFRLIHNLSAVPTDYQALLSYDPLPASDESSRSPSYTEAAGDAVLFSDPTQEGLTVENDTCENDVYLWVRLAAQAN